MRKVFPVLLLLALAALPVQAHVGSPNVFFDGDAGPYPVRVIVRPPAVIPGLAEVTVRLRDGRKVDGITVQPVQYKAGFKGAPPPDAAARVPGAPDTWSAQLWLMRGSSYTVRVAVQGPAGPGEALVPVTAVPMKVLKMDKGLGAVLVFLGLFLFVGAVSIVGAAARESVLPPGEEVDAQRRTRARVLSVAAAALFALAVWGARSWWTSVDGEVRQGLFKAFRVRTSVSGPVLRLQIDDPRRADWSPLMPDHGKLMHLFLIREPGLDAFAHLHPVMKDPDHFEVALPPLPAGTYRVYADVIHESGFPQTLVDTVKIPAGTGGPPQDPDDSWRVSAPPAPKDPDVHMVASSLEDGGIMFWLQGALVAGRETELRFKVLGPAGRPATLEPYMGMASHAVISKDDGQVFVHLHPMGTVSMAAQQAFAKKELEEEGKAAPVTMPAMGSGDTISFPYEFPRPGRYRLWVQVKTGGKVQTGVFDAEVGNKGAAAS